jgi:uncharacterized protein
MEMQEAVLLRVFLGEDKRDGERPLYEAIALKARDMRLAGATVLHGRLGFGRSARLHTSRVLVSEDLPLVVEIVDSEDKITAFLRVLEKMPAIALVTVEKVRVLEHRGASPASS